MSEVIGFPYGNKGTDNGLTDPPCDVEPNDYPHEGYRLQHVQLPDPINPPHYKQAGVEAIDIIEHVVSLYKDYPSMAYNVGAALKYLLRAPIKHPSPTDDLKKAAWHIERAGK